MVFFLTSPAFLFTLIHPLCKINNYHSLIISQSQLSDVYFTCSVNLHLKSLTLTFLHTSSALKSYRPFSLLWGCSSAWQHSTQCCAGLFCQSSSCRGDVTIIKKNVAKGKGSICGIPHISSSEQETTVYVYWHTMQIYPHTYNE